MDLTDRAPTRVTASADLRRAVAWDTAAGPGNYLSLVASQGAGVLLAFVGIWVVTRALGPAGYGGVVAVIAASHLIQQFTVQWTAVAVFRYGCEEFVQTGRLTHTFWARLGIVAPNLVLVLGTSFLWLPWLASWLDIPSRLYPALVFHFLVLVSWVHVQQALQAAKLPRIQATLLVAERAVVALACVALSVVGYASVISVTLAYSFGALAATVIALWRLRPFVTSRVHLDVGTLRKILAFSLPLIPHSMSASLSTNYLDAFFITYFLSVSDLGVYVVAYQVAGAVMQLPLLAGSLLFPFFITLRAHGDEDKIARYCREVLPLVSLIWSTVAAAAATAGIYFLRYAFGAQFQATTELLWPLMAATALLGPVLMGHAAVSNALSATYMSALASAAAGAVNIVLNLALIPRLGLVGCAWATAGAFAANMIVFACLVHRRLPSSRGWTITATLPTLSGATYAAWQADYVGALGVSAVTSAAVLLWNRRDVVTSVRTLRSSGMFAVAPRFPFQRRVS